MDLDMHQWWALVWICTVLELLGPEKGVWILDKIA